VIESGRQYYDIEIVDINKDGKNDLLVTVAAQNGGSVEVFEIPADFRNGNQYVKHVIASDFVARNGAANGRTPGVARTFYPTNNQNGKPWIYVAGADDGRAYYLRPISTAANNWDYEKVTVADYGTNQVVSGMTVADIDGDGNKELFVSIHNMNVIRVYSFAP